jgi:hypothetical protein
MVHGEVRDSFSEEAIASEEHGKRDSIPVSWRSFASFIAVALLKTGK